MNTKFSLKNFRVFDPKLGATFNIAPITILTGCNSSGKSSVVKAILLLRDFFKQLQTNIIADCKLDFGNKLAKLGKFDSTRNCNSRKGSKMTFAYTVCPPTLGKELRVQLTFEAEENDILNNGYLSQILITREDLNKTVLDLVRFNVKSARCYLVEQIDLNSIIQDFANKLLKRLIVANAHNMLPGDDIEPINELAYILQRYLGEEEYNEFRKYLVSQFGLIMHCGEDTSADDIVRRQVVDAYKYRLFFSLPLFSWLDNVPKSDVRRIIYEKMEQATTENHQFHDYKYLDKVLSAFEESAHDTFVDYFREQEDEWCILKTSPRSFLRKEYCAVGGGITKVSHISENIGYDFGVDGDDFSAMLFLLIQVCKFAIPSFTEKELNQFEEDGMFGYIEEYKLIEQLRKFYNGVISEALNPNYLPNFKYIGDSSINIQRLYSSERDDEFGRLLLKYLDASRQNEKEYKWITINAGDFINKWVKNFGFGDHISIINTAEGLGVIVKIHKTPGDKKGRLLADEGFGITKLIGTMINIETAIMSESAYVTLAIEEPENHLHPRYQALLAEMFADAYKKYNIHFIVETHSEYMVRKLQTLVARKELKQDEVSLQYVYDANPEKRPKGEPHVKNIEIREDGTLRDAFGSGFFDEADNLAMDLLTIKAMG